MPWCTSAVFALLVRRQFDIDRGVSLVIRRRGDFDLAEVGAGVEIALQFQQIIAVIGIAGLEMRVARQQLGRQEILPEADIAEAIARAGVVVGGIAAL